jgi:hypothetical protein
MKLAKCIAVMMFLAPVVTACGSKAIIRDSKAYRLEALFFKKSIDEQQEALKPRLRAACCEEGVFGASATCQKDGETYAVVHSRAQHHYDRMMFLAGFAEIDPGDAPKVDVAKVLEGVCAP